MDKEQLKQIRYIKSEIYLIENQIDNIEPTMVTDKVTGSSSHFPYVQRSFTLEGIDTEDCERRARRLQRKLIKRKEKLLQLQEEANEFISNVEDSLVRQAITLKYIDGMSWENIARKMGSNTTPDSIRMAVNRYMKS
ncbi:RNA polymerase subunit sigma-24 [Clostridium sp.]|uniref:RNA polymerase subunit sigma-24 n=1 Tax=Clostridium sp. TaxID=1506 RepID=UPI00321665FA